VESNWPPASQAEAAALPRPRFLLQQVHVLYRSQFWTWFAIMMPTTLLADVVVLWADRHAAAILRAVPFLEISNHWDKVVEATALRFGSFFAAWFLGCFALASIASAVNGLEEEGEGAAWIPDRHQRAREHLGAIFAVALITFCLFLAGIAISGFVQTAAVRVVGWRSFSRFSFAVGVISVVTVASLLSWLGASIPLLLRGNTRLWAALKRSVELSSGYEGALLLLVMQSVAGTFVAGYGTFYALHALIPSQLRYAPWYGWVVNLVAILASAAVEPPLFIGLSLLADPDVLSAPSLPRPQHAAHIQ
jgi:hypothetical protein